jgi:hypothetical protein
VHGACRPEHRSCYSPAVHRVPRVPRTLARRVVLNVPCEVSLWAGREHYHNTARYCQAHSRQARFQCRLAPLVGAIPARAARGHSIVSATVALKRWTKRGRQRRGHVRFLPTFCGHARSPRHPPGVPTRQKFPGRAAFRHRYKRHTRTAASRTQQYRQPVTEAGGEHSLRGRAGGDELGHGYMPFWVEPRRRLQEQFHRRRIAAIGTPSRRRQ